MPSLEVHLKKACTMKDIYGKEQQKNGSWRKEIISPTEEDKEEKEALPSERCENLTSIKQEGDTNNYRSKRTWKFKIWV